MPRPLAAQDTSQRILDIAARLVQSRGFNGFSYADVASELDVTKASLHYHFPTKAELGRRLIERYEQAFVAALEQIERDNAGALQRLVAYTKIYADVLSNDQMCLCGMLAAEHGTLPEPMRQVLKHYFDVNECWLSRVLEHGRAQQQLRFSGAPLELARMLVGSLEGAMMLARSYGDLARFNSVAERLLNELRPARAEATASHAVARPRAQARRAVTKRTR